jgi:hypothetical protein
MTHTTGFLAARSLLRETGMKFCYMCDKTKSATEFYHDRSRPDGLSSRCKPCNTTHSAKYIPSKEKHHAYTLSYYYGMTEVQYADLVAEQGGVCKICKTKPERVLAVDHDSKTKEIRGLLCRRCNSAIGLFDHDPEKLEAAAEYIRCK